MLPVVTHGYTQPLLSAYSASTVASSSVESFSGLNLVHSAVAANGSVQNVQNNTRPAQTKENNSLAKSGILADDASESRQIAISSDEEYLPYDSSFLAQLIGQKPSFAENNQELSASNDNVAGLILSYETSQEFADVKYKPSYAAKPREGGVVSSEYVYKDLTEEQPIFPQTDAVSGYESFGSNYQYYEERLLADEAYELGLKLVNSDYKSSNADPVTIIS